MTLKAERWDAPPPSCEACDSREMRQEFKPPAIGGSMRSKAAAITEDILARDYNVANVQFDNREGAAPKVRYKDQAAGLPAGAWAAAQQTLQQAVDIGRQHRRTRYDSGPQGNGLDVLQAALRSGEQPDLIAASKQRSIKVW